MLYRSWIEISRKNLLYNLSVFKRLVGKNVKVACVVKANAYGHGLDEVVSILGNKTDLFAVDNFEEAFEIKKLQVKKPILILGYIPTFRLKGVIDGGFSFVVYNLKTLTKIVSIRQNKTARIHLKIETGLNRQGIKISDLPKFLAFIKKNNNKFEVDGISSHFANIEDTLDPSFAEFQLANFKKALEIVSKNGISPKYIHTAASAATILYPKTHFNTVRVGLGLYGLWPSMETKIAAKRMKRKIQLNPVLSWKSIVGQVKKIKAGESVGYGRTWIVPCDSKIAVIPVGYYDGFDRKLSNSGRVLIGGKSVPVVGRVAMNMVMIDITGIPKVSLEDEVVILGKMGRLEISAEEIADKLGTINYEIISRINPILPRVVV